MPAFHHFVLSLSLAFPRLIYPSLSLPVKPKVFLCSHSLLSLPLLCGTIDLLPYSTLSHPPRKGGRKEERTGNPIMDEVGAEIWVDNQGFFPSFLQSPLFHSPLFPSLDPFLGYLPSSSLNLPSYRPSLLFPPPRPRPNRQKPARACVR